MDHDISRAGLRLKYLCDQAAIEALDFNKILDDLAEPSNRYQLSHWFATNLVAGIDHLVLAIDCRTGRHVAMMSANDGATEREVYLDLHAAMMIEPMRDTMLTRIMLGYAISRIALFGTPPQIIAARSSWSVCYRLLSVFATGVPAAALFPRLDPTLVDLHRAGLARRIARSLAPQCDYDAASGIIKRGRLSGATCFARVMNSDSAIDILHERKLRGDDQMLVVLDMAHCDPEAITGFAERLVRRRWQGPKSRTVAAVPAERPNQAQVPPLTA